MTRTVRLVGLVVLVIAGLVLMRTLRFGWTAFVALPLLIENILWFVTSMVLVFVLIALQHFKMELQRLDHAIQLLKDRAPKDRDG